MMTNNRERPPTKQCPQCGYDAKGQAQEVPDPAVIKRVPPPRKFDFDCGNCGFQWTE